MSAILCLALNIFWEARSEDKFGVMAMSAPAMVVLNRVADPRYPNDVCEVVRQAKKNHNGFPKKNQCQFSWYCDGKSDLPMNKEAWKWSKLIARMVLEGKIEDVTNGATHYHAHYVNPQWNIKKTFTGKIGSHLFYRWERS